MKKIEATLTQDGVLTIDLGGDLDNSCCGTEARQLNMALKELGVELRPEGIHCRLPVMERLAAKSSGECNAETGKEVVR